MGLLHIQELKIPGKLEIQAPAPYNLCQISHRHRTDWFKGYAYDNTAGSGTTAYVVDTGINVDHIELSYRARKGYNAVPRDPFSDTAGHGTYIAGLVGGTFYGVAKKCQVVDVKVMKSTVARTGYLLVGYNWAVNDIIQRSSQGKAVVIIALSGESVALGQAINAASRKGITTVVAAGNIPQKTPWSGKAMVVGATDRAKERWHKSSFGPEVTLFAPGVSVTAATAGPQKGDDAVARKSGTSAAAAHVAGVVLTLKAIRNLPNAKYTERELLGLATKWSVVDTQGSPNLFLYNGSKQ